MPIDVTNTAAFTDLVRRVCDLAHCKQCGVPLTSECANDWADADADIADMIADAIEANGGRLDGLDPRQILDDDGCPIETGRCWECTHYGPDWKRPRVYNPDWHKNRLAHSTKTG